MLETLWRDLRHGARMLAKNPGFAAVAMLSIAVGVGANAAMFSVADGLVLRPAAGREPGPDSDDHGHVARHRLPQSQPLVSRIRGRARPVAQFRRRRGLHDGADQLRDSPRRDRAAQGRHGGERQPVRRHGRAATRRPRASGADEDEAGRPLPVVVLDHDEWVRSFGSNPGVVGIERPHRRHRSHRDRRGAARTSPASITTCTRRSTCRWRCGRRCWPAPAGRPDPARRPGTAAGGESAPEAGPDGGAGAGGRGADRRRT